MKFYKMSFVKRKIRTLCWKIFNYIENNNNTNFERNGEKLFLESMIMFYVENNCKELIIFDVGANVGNYSKMLMSLLKNKKLNYKFYLFEPTKSCCEVLNKTFNDKNIQINCFGLSDEEKITEIYFDEEKSGLASLYKRKLDHYDINFEKSELVMLKRADKFIESIGLSHINLVKIDVEGHEIKVLKGFGRFLCSDFIDFIQFEYGGAFLDSHTNLIDIYYLLENCGFKIAKIMPRGLEIRDYAPYMEIFQYSNYVAISQRILDNINIEC